VTSIIPAGEPPPRCPQADKAPFHYYSWQGDEDCLFLNVYAPKNAKDLPVFVWIHGGGYGGGDSNQFPTSIIERSKNTIIGVAIQYRLGAFGFLASNEVKQHGALNTGLLDQRFALEWVQKYIHLFGGNASHVTIGGHSAGAGAVLLQALASGVNQSVELFSNIIAPSPYLPTMYIYNDSVPTGWYDLLLETVGCKNPNDTAVDDSSSSFDCLQNTPSLTLQDANALISASGPYGSWAFVPVTDGIFLPSEPSQQLGTGKIGGYRVLSGHTAEEAPHFVPQNITSEFELMRWLNLTYPYLTAEKIENLLQHYHLSELKNLSDNQARYATDGFGSTTALTTSTLATGYQQLANNVYAEATFACPSYWLVDAFSIGGSHQQKIARSGFKYQYSVPAALHGSDLAAVYGGNEEQGMGLDLSGAFQLSWANFITNNDPSIPVKYANGRALGLGDTGAEKLARWPTWQANGERLMVNYNQTGGDEYTATVVQGAPEVVLFKGQRLRNWFNVYDAWDWEGGRGERCELWRTLTSTTRN
jgi:carboxylesterase type B